MVVVLRVFAALQRNLERIDRPDGRNLYSRIV
jgi:hypothetical protein